MTDILVVPSGTNVLSLDDEVVTAIRKLADGLSIKTTRSSARPSPATSANGDAGNGKLVDLHEAAKLVGQPEAAVYRALRRGNLKARKVGRRNMFNREAVERWAKSLK